MPPNEEFKRIIESQGLTRPKVAGMLEISVSAIDSYLAPKDAACYRKMPASRLSHFKMINKTKGI